MAEDDDERLAKLRGSLAKARGARQSQETARAAKPEAQKGDSGMSLGMRAGGEFVSAIVVGAGIGWAIDRLLGTNPAFLIVFFFIGVAAGVWNVIRLTSPKGGGLARDSRLSHPEAADKGLRRSGSEAAPDPWRGASGGANPAGRADDDED